MNDKIKDNYFFISRLFLMLVLIFCSIVSVYLSGERAVFNETGVSIKVLLLVSFYIGCMALKELFSDFKKRIFLFLSVLAVMGLYIFGGKCFLLLLIFTAYEVLSEFPRIDYGWYFVPVLIAFLDTPLGHLMQFLVAFFLMVIYIQHNFVVKDYKNRMVEDTLLEQGLKRDMREQEYAAKAELRRNILQTENQILEERASLSQTLHDKLGHSINGSIYQLEGVKVLMDKDPERSKGMIQAVIDQLRSGMDEIRAILRKERPEKKEMAMLELYKLCEDCNDKGIETKLDVDGDIAVISDVIWEVILDNAFEAVSNSMKYAKCKNIEIKLKVMNKMVRCSVRDDGIGCADFEDGMGISGMRQRVRAVNGTLSFEAEVGFTVNMILPL